MSSLPTEPIYSKLLIQTLKPQYKETRIPIVSIVAMLSVENVFVTPFLNETQIKPPERRLFEL